MRAKTFQSRKERVPSLPPRPVGTVSPTDTRYRRSPLIFTAPFGNLATSLFALCALISVLTTAPCTQAAERAAPYRVTNWQVEDGLPQNTIQKITQTSDGYLWLATTHDVIRFDGLEFRILAGDDLSNFDFRSVRCLFGDQDGALWIGTNQGLIRYQEGELSWIDGPEEFAPIKINNICQAPNGRIYMTSKLAVFEFRDEVLVPITEEGPESPDGGWVITADAKNRVWVSWGNTLYRRENDQWSREIQFPRIINYISSDSDGTIWCGLNAGYFAWLKPGGKENIKVYPGGSIFDVAQNQKGDVFFRVSDRLHRFPDGENVPLFLQNGEPVERIQIIFQDREKNLWLGTKGKGLVLLEPQPLATYSTEAGLPYPEVKTIAQFDADCLWLGTTGGGLAKLQGETFHPIEFTGYSNIGAIQRSRDGQLWVGTYGNHLWHIDQGQPTIETRSRALTGRCLFEDIEGALWVGGEGMGAERLTSNQVVRLDTGSGLVSDNVRCFAQDQSNAIWIGTDRGLHRYWNNKVEAFTTHEGLRDARVQSLFVDSSGTLWIGTEARGLTRFQNGSFDTIRTEQGFFSESVAQMLEDDLGYLWLGTNRRLFRTQLDELNRAFDQGEDKLIGKSFGKEDGMRSQECTGGFQPNCLKASDGILWFCTADGVVRADPASVQEKAVLPDIHIDLFLADGEPVRKENASDSETFDLVPKLGVYDSFGASSVAQDLKENRFVVPPGAGRLEIHYTGINFTAPTSVHYRYRLSNYDTDWTVAGSQSIAAYTQVAPGTYEFEVQAGNSEGKFNPVSRKLAFVVRPTLIQSGWFRVSVGLGVCAALVALTYGPIQRRRQLAKMRIQIARDLHDEVGSNLGSISLYSQLAREKAGETSPAVEEFDEITRTIHRTAQSLRDVIWFTNPEFDTLRGMLQQMEDTANRMLVGKQIAFKADCPVSDRRLSLNFRRQVFLIFREITHNILKHSQASHVKITIFARRNVLSLKIADDGVGFDPNNGRRGNGLNNMQQRAEELKGRVTFHSQPGQGSTILFEIPMT